jgi:3D-(3,5/4)-trihydroxycyclohexane-1,2-dione acylhydrolase (decyclizing)
MVTGAALATINRIPVLLLPSDFFATRAASPVLQELEDPRSYDVQRQRRVPAGVAVLGPDQPAGAAAVGAAGRDAGAHRPGRDRRGHPGAPAGRAGRGARLAGRAVRRSGLARAPPAPEPPRWPRRRGTPPRPQAARHRGRRRHLLRGRPGAARGSPRRPASRSPTPRRARAPWPGTTRAPSAASAPPAPRWPTRWPARPGVVLGIGTRYSDFTTASRTAFQHPDVKFVNLNVAAFDAGKHAGRQPGRRRPGRT